MIAIGSDHGGFALKQEVMAFLHSMGCEYKDFGTTKPESCDYPLYAKAVGKAVACGDCEKGILICGTGIGVCMAANKINGIRAALCTDSFSTRHTRLHNDANIICLGGRTIGPGLACELVEIFLNTSFEGGRHARRVAQVMQLEEEQ